MSKAFASQADLTDKKISFTQLSANAYAYTAEGDPNTGVIVGDDAVMVIKDWPHTLDRLAALQPRALVPGRGAALTTPEQVAQGLKGTRDFIADVYASVQAGVKAGKDLNAVYKETFAKLKPKYGHWVIFDHCMPFDVTRCYDEATQYADPRIWTAERDRQMWETLEA